LADQFPTLADLARANVEGFVHDNKTDFPGIGAATLRKLKIRAELAIAEDPVPFLTRLVVWPTAAVELFFDIETDPMRDLCYLHGFVIREGGDTNAERFEGVFAEDLSAGAECEAFAAAIEWFDQWAKGRDPALRQRLLEYNEDDCRAMRVVVDQMKAFQIFIGVD
jgi:predicted RecB family nuclease